MSGVLYRKGYKTAIVFQLFRIMSAIDSVIWWIEDWALLLTYIILLYFKKDTFVLIFQIIIDLVTKKKNVQIMFETSHDTNYDKNVNNKKWLYSET